MKAKSWAKHKTVLSLGFLKFKTGIIIIGPISSENRCRKFALVVVRAGTAAGVPCCGPPSVPRDSAGGVRSADGAPPGVGALGILWENISKAPFGEQSCLHHGLKS